MVQNKVMLVMASKQLYVLGIKIHHSGSQHLHVHSQHMDENYHLSCGLSPRPAQKKMETNDSLYLKTFVKLCYLHQQML